MVPAMPQADDQKLREDLSATSQSLVDDAERLVKIEQAKQDLDAADPEVDALSIEAERLALQIEKKSRMERDLADDIEHEQATGRSN